MTVLWNRKFVDGRGRRYMDSVDGSPQPYGFTTLITLNSAVLVGTANAMRIRPLLRSRL